jgi:hypothetical protein
MKLVQLHYDTMTALVRDINDSEHGKDVLAIVPATRGYRVVLRVSSLNGRVLERTAAAQRAVMKDTPDDA